jgi:beta-lactamase class A
MQSLLGKIEQLIGESGAEIVAVAAGDCNSGSSLLLNPELKFHPASTIKICIMMEVFHQVSQGIISLEGFLPIHNNFHSIVDQSDYALSIADDSEPGLYASIGGIKSIRELTTLMMGQSSNLATNLLVECVTAGKVNALMRALGTDELLILRGVEDQQAFTHGLNNAASAHGLMKILLRLAAHQVVSRDASEEMIAIMKQEQFKAGIPSLLPVGVSVAHKTGWIRKHYHDAAIIYPAGSDPYVLVVLTRGLSEDKEGPGLVTSISRLIYDHRSEWR